MVKITIAVDGYSSTGKSTLAKQLAAELGYAYVDSGAMYRCVTLFAMQGGLFEESLNSEALIAQLDKISISFQSDPERGNRAILNGVDVEDSIRTMDVSNRVSEVATIPEVRQFLVASQKKYGKEKGVVMDGRDIGTVVFPNAELKIFMTASAHVRAQRRLDELQAKGEEVSFDEVYKNIVSRDELDTTRKDSPLMQAVDARVLDNSNISREEQFQTALRWANEAISEAS